MLLRRVVLLAIFVGTVAQSGAVAKTALAVTVAAFLSLHIAVAPFESALNNALETVSLSYVGLILAVNLAGISAYAQAVLSLAVLALGAVVLVAPIVVGVATGVLAALRARWAAATAAKDGQSGDALRVQLLGDGVAEDAGL